MRLWSRFIQALVVVVLTCVSVLSFGNLPTPTVNMTPGVTPISRDIYDLHMVIFWICVVIGIIVFAVLIYALIKHRKSIGHKAATFHENTTVEITWAVIPFIILVVMAIPATRVLMDMRDVSKSEITIKVTGYQWKWHYDYLDQGISFFSNLATPLDTIENYLWAKKQPTLSKQKWYLLDVDHPLVIPAHTKVRFLVTSNDVIHSWWVPALGVKRDAMPGFIYEAWAEVDKPGIYRGQCAELCGAHHGFMPIVVKVVSKPEFSQWVNSQKQQAAAAKQASNQTYTREELMTLGKKEYDKVCAACHKPDGSGMPPAFPALKDGPLIVNSLKTHIDIVLHGKAGTAMQAFGKQLDAKTLAAIITYERNAWGNDKLIKDKKTLIVQPSEIKKALAK